MSELTLLRPLWLLALLPLAWLCWRQLHPPRRTQALIRPSLLAYLAPAQAAIPARRRRGLLLPCLLAIVALAGPAHRQAGALYHAGQSWIWLLDVSHSMLADDLPPTRLTQARAGLLNLMERAPAQAIGLIAFAGGAYLVSPATRDHDSLRYLLRELEPELMPRPGSDPVAAVRLGLATLARSGSTDGRLLLISDGLSPEQAHQLRGLLAEQPGRLDILAVGSQQGGPVPLGNGSLLKDEQGRPVMAHTDLPLLAATANEIGGRFARLTDSAALARLLLPADAGQIAGPSASQPQDLGYWLLLPLLGLALTFRRGLLWMSTLLLLLPQAAPVSAESALALYEAGRYEEAAAHFTDPLWRGNALFRAGHYLEAAQSYADSATVRGHYNRGNALAFAGDLDGALAAYQAALALDPQHADAWHNSGLIRQWQRQQAPPPPETGQVADAAGMTRRPGGQPLPRGSLLRQRLQRQEANAPHSYRGPPW